MTLLSVTYLLNGFLMIAMPVGLTIYLTRKYKLGWRLFWIGAATFLFSQMMHIPFNALLIPVFSQTPFIGLPEVLKNVFLSITLGLSAGIFEEFSRYAMYRWWAKDARSWGSGLLTGAGHGGIEAIILGILVLYGYVQMLAVRGVDISTLVTPDRVELAKAQIQAYWSAPWYMTLLGAVERFFTIPLHIACSVLVLQTFTRKKLYWVGIAILYHALADGFVVYFSMVGFTAIALEGIVGSFAILSVIIIFALRQHESLEKTIITAVRIPEFNSGEVNETRENLDQTRYQ